MRACGGRAFGCLSLSRACSCVALSFLSPTSLTRLPPPHHQGSTVSLLCFRGGVGNLYGNLGPSDEWLSEFLDKVRWDAVGFRWDSVAVLLVVGHNDVVPMNSTAHTTTPTIHHRCTACTADTADTAHHAHANARHPPHQVKPAAAAAPAAEPVAAE